MATELYSLLSTLHSLLSILYFPFSTLHCLLGDCVIPFSFPIARDEAHAGKAITMITPSEEGWGLKAIRYTVKLQPLNQTCARVRAPARSQDTIRPPSEPTRRFELRADEVRKI